MSKINGLGAGFVMGGYNIAGDVTDFDCSAAVGVLDVTDITQSAHSRLQGLHDGTMAITVLMDPANAHPVLASLPTADTLMEALLPPLAIGSPVACLNAKQIDYPPSRANDGMLSMKVEGHANGYGLEWGLQLTPGLRTDTAATNGPSLNNGAASLWGAQAYLQLTAFTGTNVTVTLQHAPDNATWTTLLGFTAQTAAPATQRLATFTGPFTATNASPCVFTAPGSALANGTPVVLSNPPAPQALPGGFTAGTTYYVVSASGTTFELSTSSGGSAVNSTSAGSGFVNQLVEQYLRVISAGTFSSATFVVAANRNAAQLAG
jgi:hypothetical protein